MSDIDTSSWKEFKVSEIFGKAKLGKYHNPEELIEDENGYPYICASNQNNGINSQMPLVNGKNLMLTPEKIIAWGKQCPMFCYHDKPCVTSQGMYYIELPNNINEAVALFICTLLTKACGQKFNYGNCLIGSKMDEIIIKLPVKESEEIDWEYMQERITELEQERITELERYLIATGLNDYELTNEDKEILATKLTNGGILADLTPGNGCLKEARMFRVGELFEVKTPVKRFNANAVEITDNIGHPYVVRSSANNGIRGYIDEDGSYLNEGNIFSFGQDTATIFWQEKPYFTGDKIKVLKPKFECNSEIASYVMNGIAMAFSHFSWGTQSFKVSVIEDGEFLLPVTSDGEPDWTYMEKYIRAIEKNVIKDVVDYKDEVIAKTKKAVI